ncbi:shematrin-like protein 1 [Eurosta solidaginis]|uniref:shematrin-like protein 1 n=1 Tax=Eurosta solidaginis TaxID=178769 RepID=UPI0035308070
MRSFIVTELILALTLVPTLAQFTFPASQTAYESNRLPRNPAQTSTYGLPNSNSINGGYIGNSYPIQAGLNNSRYRGVVGGTDSLTAPSSSSANGNPNSRTLGLLGGLGGGGGGGIFGNLLGALTGGNRRPFGGGVGGVYPYPVPAPYPGFYGVPPYGGGFGYPGYGGGFFG